MSDYNFPPPPDKDPHLWRLAQKRTSFKSHLSTYLVVNGFLWLLWYFTGSDHYGNGFPWPAYSTLGWGIGLFFHFLGAYVNTGDAIENEYNKLKNQHK